jgi:hypothetical protein
MYVFILRHNAGVVRQTAMFNGENRFTDRYFIGAGLKKHKL